ncbi:MAG: phenylalanine--tRNA ligase subunit beta [Gemmataceae bacterium]|nr:phenylalanine--tRNA ligase subunit beta [Gemmataceae bacterium]MCI0738404.1 phenylalanine--tRNA ligase subunit beta [Gemmataceae bacterium]
MKIPLNWLKEYVDLTLPPAQLVERLTLAGLEVAGVRVLGLPIPEGVRVKAEERGPVWERDKIVIAEVLSVEKHPNADRLTLPTVTWGEGKTKLLVTGAPNIKVGDKGQKVVLGLTGSVLFDGHSEVKTLKELKPSKIRGVASDSMVCSLLELGISEEHEGIIILEDDAPVGMPLVDFMGDIILEVDVLPNMARCLSMIGVAREVAALTGQTLKLPASRFALESSDKNREPISGQVNVEIENPKLCARYAAALIKGVIIGAAPGWMQRRLTYAGMRPISNIVDITNFVMLEWGQPLHAFDYDLLVKRAGGKTPTIIVRSARAGEVLVTLDGQKRELNPEHLLIADTAGPIALAGVMGGRDTEVTAQTKNILLESANFDFVSIRRTMKHFNLPSEASVRFSRGIHPETVLPAAMRAAELMSQCAGGTVCAGVVDNYPAPLPPQVVELKLSAASRLLGVEFPKAEAVRILKALEFGVEDKGADTLRVTTPPHRLDIQVGEADLIEELVRVYGYDRLPSTLLADQLPRQETNSELVFEERVRDIIVGCGLQEVVTYALTTPEREAPFGPADNSLRPSGGEGTGVRGRRAGLEDSPRDVEYVTLKNPISSERVVMRQSLLASVLEVTAANLRHSEDVRFFEVGRVYLPRTGQPLPREPRRLAIVLTGRRTPEFWADGPSAEKKPLDFFDLKGVIVALLEDLQMSAAQFQNHTAGPWLPGRAADLLVQGKPIGVFGQLHFKTVESLGMGARSILAADLDLEALQAAVPVRYSFAPVPRFPSALRDIAVIVDEAITADKATAEIRAAGGELLRGVRLFDLYRGDSIPKDTKSLAFALTYQADDRTLTDKEVDKAHKKIEDRLKHVLKAQIRGKE